MRLAIGLGLLLAACTAAAQEADADARRAEEARLDAEEAALLAQPSPTPEEQAQIDAVKAAMAAAQPQYATPAADPAPAFPELRPVLEQFGGEAGLTAIMDTFMTRLLADERLGPFFAEADQARVKRQLVEQFCVILGGDCTYSGRDMRQTHAGLAIDRADFNRLVEVLQDAMDAHDVPFAAQNRLLAKLAPMHREVVTE